MHQPTEIGNDEWKQRFLSLGIPKVIINDPEIEWDAIKALYPLLKRLNESTELQDSFIIEKWQLQLLSGEHRFYKMYIDKKTPKGSSIALYAALIGNLGILNWIKNNHPKLLAVKDMYGRNIAHHVATNRDDPTVLAWINNCMPNLLSAKDARDCNIAHLAAFHKNRKVLAWIKENRPELLKVKVQKELTVVDCAAQSDDPEIFNYALSISPQPSQCTYHVFQSGARMEGEVICHALDSNYTLTSVSFKLMTINSDIQNEINQKLLRNRLITQAMESFSIYLQGFFQKQATDSRLLPNEILVNILKPTLPAGIPTTVVSKLFNKAWERVDPNLRYERREARLMKRIEKELTLEKDLTRHANLQALQTNVATNTDKTLSVLAAIITNWQEENVVGETLFKFLFNTFLPTKKQQFITDINHIAGLTAHKNNASISEENPEKALEDRKAKAEASHLEASDGANDQLDALKLLLRKGITAYLEWQKNGDKSILKAGLFTKIRHGKFGMERAERLCEKITSASNMPTLLAILHAHFSEASRVHDHSLDTYLLKNINNTGNHVLFDIESKTNLSIYKNRNLFLDKIQSYISRQDTTLKPGHRT